MNSENELFDKYVKGQLSGEELAAFEASLKTDAAFRQHAEEHRLLVNQLKSFHQRNQAQNILRDEHESMEKIRTLNPQNPPRSRFWPMAAVAASIAMISIVGT